MTSDIQPFIAMMTYFLNACRVCRFHLQLAMFSSDRGSALLNVVEANPFKHLIHLSLKLLHANDSVLKKYLAECLVALRVSWTCWVEGGRRATLLLTASTDLSM